MQYNFILKVIEIILQLILVIFAGQALFVWKKEMRGKDKYKLAKDLLTYIKNLRFLIYSKDESTYQIFLNDIFTGKKSFYTDTMAVVGQEHVYFDESVWGLFSEISVRSDI